jgi:hypothetical protein
MTHALKTRRYYFWPILLIFVGVFGWRYNCQKITQKPEPTRSHIYEKPGAPKWQVIRDDPDQPSPQVRIIVSKEFPDGKAQIYSVKDQTWKDVPPGLIK